MLVYIAEWSDGYLVEDYISGIIGIYSTLEKAQDAAEEFRANEKFPSDRLHVIEFEVDGGEMRKIWNWNVHGDYAPDRTWTLQYEADLQEPSD